MRALSSRRSSGFTLIEMLVSIAILSILVAILGTLLTGAQGVIDLSTRHLTADAQARMVFDRMGNDLSHMVRAPGMDALFFKANAAGHNDAMFFLARSAGDDPGGNAALSPLSLVGYRVNPATFQLERLGRVLNWDTMGGTAAPVFNGADTTATPITLASTQPFASIVGTSADYYTDGADPGYQVLADGVFRLSFFPLQTITTSDPTGTTIQMAYLTSLPSVPGDANPGGTPLDFTEVAGGKTTRTRIQALLVGVAVMDSTSRLHGSLSGQTVPNVNSVTALPDPKVATLASSTGSSLAGSWNALMAPSSFASSAGLTAAGAGQIRVYQRTFYLEGQSYQP